MPGREPYFKKKRAHAGFEALFERKNLLFNQEAAYPYHDI
jgi:hypothetical protein